MEYGLKKSDDVPIRYYFLTGGSTPRVNPNAYSLSQDVQFFTDNESTPHKKFGESIFLRWCENDDYAKDKKYFSFFKNIQNVKKRLRNKESEQKIVGLLKKIIGKVVKIDNCYREINFLSYVCLVKEISNLLREKTDVVKILVKRFLELERKNVFIISQFMIMLFFKSFSFYPENTKKILESRRASKLIFRICYRNLTKVLNLDFYQMKIVGFSLECALNLIILKENIFKFKYFMKHYELYVGKEFVFDDFLKNTLLYLINERIIPQCSFGDLGLTYLYFKYFNGLAFNTKTLKYTKKYCKESTIKGIVKFFKHLKNEIWNTENRNCLTYDIMNDIFRCLSFLCSEFGDPYVFTKHAMYVIDLCLDIVMKRNRLLERGFVELSINILENLAINSPTNIKTFLFKKYERFIEDFARFGTFKSFDKISYMKNRLCRIIIGFACNGKTGGKFYEKHGKFINLLFLYSVRKINVEEIVKSGPEEISFFRHLLLVVLYNDDLIRSNGEEFVKENKDLITPLIKLYYKVPPRIKSTILAFMRRVVIINFKKVKPFLKQSLELLTFVENIKKDIETVENKGYKKNFESFLSVIEESVIGDSPPKELKEVRLLNYFLMGKELFESKEVNFLSYKNCSFCGKEKAEKRCGACKKVYYCNRECQVSHWNVHKVECNKVDDNMSHFRK